MPRHIWYSLTMGRHRDPPLQYVKARNRGLKPLLQGELGKHLEIWNQIILSYLYYLRT